MLVKKVTVKAKEGENITPHINQTISDYLLDNDLRETINTKPLTGIAENGNKYILWLGKSSAVFVLRKDKKTVDIGVIIKARSIAEINTELSKHGININNIYSTTDTIWQQLRSCLMAAIALDDTDQPVEKDEPDTPDEPEEPDSTTKGDQPELPFEETDFEVPEPVQKYVRTAENEQKRKSNSIKL